MRRTKKAKLRGAPRPTTLKARRKTLRMWRDLERGKALFISWANFEHQTSLCRPIFATSILFGHHLGVVVRETRFL